MGRAFRHLRIGTCLGRLLSACSEIFLKGARADIDEIVAESGNKGSDAATLSVAECMAEAGLVGKVFGHNSL